MHIIIVGCGRVGAELANRLYQRGNQVAVIDQVEAAFDNLAPDFRGRIVEGDVLNRDVLRRAGIFQADALAAVTNSDALNAVVGHIARSIFQVPCVIVRNYDPRSRPLFEVFGLQVVGSSSWGAQRIEELLYRSDMRTVFSAGNGEVEIYEWMIPREWEGRRLQEFLPMEGCVPVALTRAGRAILPSADTVLQCGDILNWSATGEGMDALRQRLLRGGD